MLAMPSSQPKQSYGCGVGDVECSQNSCTDVELAMSSSPPRLY